LFLSHARCSDCQGWFRTESQKWTQKQVKHHRLSGSGLSCATCVDGCQTRGQTLRDRELYPCAACKGEKGRAEFGKSQLDRKRRERTYLLLCSICHTREKELLERLRSPDVWKCTKKCVFGHGHVTACKANPYWYGYSRNPVHCVTRAELRFLHFRTENRKYH
jgi:hypothetical protein